MYRSKDFSAVIFITFGLIFLLTNFAVGQLELEWYMETPVGEDHRFRDVAVNVADKKLYISDSYTDLVYIYRTDHPHQPIDSFGDSSWQGLPGPYGIDIAEDQQVYIAVMLIDDKDGNNVEDHSLWRCTPSGNNLQRVCTLPDRPRGIKVIGGGINTVVYVSGNSGKIIRCTPVNFHNEFNTDILFEVNTTNQQDILTDICEEHIYTSYWSHNAPYGSSVLKWDMVNGSWQLNDQFSTSHLLPGNYPGIDFNHEQNALYLFQVGFNENSSHIYKVDPASGIDVNSVSVAPTIFGAHSSTGAGGIDVTRKGHIYFAANLGMKDGYFTSVYGYVRDLNHTELDENNVLDQNDKNTGSEAVQAFYLSQNQPNPFNPSTVIEFKLPESEFVTCKIFNTRGQEIKTILKQTLPAGMHRYNLDAGDLPNGNYFYSLRAGQFYDVKKMVLVK